MKTIFRNILLATATMLFFSCTGFLDRQPLNQMSSTVFWRNQTDADMALAGLYSRLNASSFNHYQGYWSGVADDIFCSNGWGIVLISGNAQATDSYASRVYVDSYKGIATANDFLDNIDKITSLNDKEKSQYKGEAYFMRALFYFYLTEFYGDVPLHLKTVYTVDESKVKQTAKSVIVEQMLKDLDFAIANLPDMPYSGHAVKGSALALKAKYLLHNEKWAEASVAAKAIINSKIFSLYNKYPDIFLAKGQDNNSEIIFSNKYLLPDSYHRLDADLLIDGIYDPRQDFVDEFEYKDGRLISNPSAIDNDPDNWSNRDPRLSYTVRRDTTHFVTSAGIRFLNWVYSSTSGYKNNKHLNVDAYPIVSSTKSDQDWVLLRYADVLLMYAEAENEAKGPYSAVGPSVAEAVNMVRARVGMPGIPTSGLDKDTMRQLIRHERRVELGIEGSRYLDIKRWKIAEKIIPKIVLPGSGNRLFDPNRDYVWPFPQTDCDINPNLDQKPGYTK